MAKNLDDLEMSELMECVFITRMGVEQVIKELYQAHNSIDKNKIVQQLLVLDNIHHNLIIVEMKLWDRFPEDYDKFFDKLHSLDE